MTSTNKRSLSASDDDDCENSKMTNDSDDSVCSTTEHQKTTTTDEQEQQTNSDEVLTYVALTKFAFKPTKGTEQSVGFDLRSPREYTIEPGTQVTIPLDLTFQFPLGCYGWIASRSGMAAKHQVVVLGGIIDRDYTGNVVVILRNQSTVDYRVYAGDRIAQLIVQRASYPSLVQAQPSIISSTARGTNGLGSTGV